MKLTRLLTSLSFSLLFTGALFAQDTSSKAYIDISKIGLSRVVGKKIFFTAYINHHESLTEKYSSLAFQKGPGYTGFIPNEIVTKKPVVRFYLRNTSDSSSSIWFFPGLHFWDIQLYRAEGNQLVRLPVVYPHNEDSISYRQITLAGHDSITIVAELVQVKTYLNNVNPRLINDKYLTSYIIEFHASNPQSDLITYLFCGLLLMLIVFSLANFIQDGNKEFLYYSGYAFFLGVMLFCKALYSFHTTWVSFFQEEYLDFIMQSVGVMCYMAFMQKFLATKTQHRLLHIVYNAGIAMLAISMIGYTWLHYFTDNFVLENGLENLTKIMLLVMVVIFLFYGIKHWKDKLLRYLFWGNLCLFFFSLLSQVIVMVDALRGLPGILGSSLFYYEMGLFLELVFFLAGLNHKNRRQLIGQAQERERLKADNQMKEYEKELAVFKAQKEERERISADMHDELGSGMTAIRLMSEIARNKMKENTPVEIEKISHSADEVLNKMNAIIWSMNSGNDTVDNLVSYIRSYALEYFENTPINCRVNIPDRIAQIDISGDKRRNVFLCVKETLNNAMKHSKASELRINIMIGDKLEICISDNGIGIRMDSIRQFGNGLKNIAKRMESIGGTYHIENNNGTMTILTLPL